MGGKKVYKMNITTYERDPIYNKPFEDTKLQSPVEGHESSYTSVGNKIYFRNDKSVGWFDMGGFFSRERPHTFYFLERQFTLFFPKKHFLS